MEIGNPALNPTTAMNVDVMAEHYFKSVGVLSGGFFFKDLTDYIYVSSSEQSGGAFDGFETTQPVNGKSATLFGFELNWQQQLTFPSWSAKWTGNLRKLYVYRFRGRGTGTRRENYSGRDRHSMGNVALSYEKYGISRRVALNFAGDFISEVGGEPAEDIYYDKHVQLDISLSQRITKQIQVFAELINLTDEPLRYYQGTTDFPIAQEFYSWWGHLGVRFDL